MTVIKKRNMLAALVALFICIALMASGCSGTEEAAMESDAGTNDIEENAAEDTEDTEDTAGTADAIPGVYAEISQTDKTIEIIPIPGGITDSTVLPTFKCTFGDMTDEAQNALEEGRSFPKEFFRDLVIEQHLSYACLVTYVTEYNAAQISSPSLRSQQHK